MEDRMNLKELDQKWQDNCPEEAQGLVSKRIMPKRWAMKIQAYKNKKKIGQRLKKHFKS